MFDNLEPRRMLAQVGIDLLYGSDGIASISRSGLTGISFVQPLPGSAFLLGLQERTANDNVAASVIRVRADGTQDPAFGTNGSTRISEAALFADHTARDPNDGRVAIIGGSSNDSSSQIILLRANGTLDTSFSSDGKLTLTRGSAVLRLQTAAFASDGKLIVAAKLDEELSENASTYTQFIIRLNRNGTLDNTFGIAGFATLAVGEFSRTPGSFGFPTTSSSDDYEVTHLQFDTDGAIVALAYRNSSFDDGFDQSFSELTQLYRITSSGSTDVGFAGGEPVQLGGVYLGKHIGLRVTARGYEVLTHEDNSTESAFFSTVTRNLISRTGVVRSTEESYRVNGNSDVIESPDGGFFAFVGGEVTRLLGDLTIDRSFGVGGAAFFSRPSPVESEQAVSSSGSPVQFMITSAQLSGGPTPTLRSVRFTGELVFVNTTPATVLRSGDTLEVLGTTGDDRIQIDRNGDQLQVQINDNPPELFDNEIAQIIVSAGAGNDQVHTATFGRIILLGGDGNDRLTSSTFTLNGQTVRPDTSMFGGSGRDTLFGSGFGDLLDGGLDRDLIRCSGPSTLIGGRGSDQLFGSVFDDVLEGGGGDDYLFGGRGADLLRGQAGRDTLTGAAADDTLFGGRGEIDLLTGGTGFDAADPDPLDRQREIESVL